jgi:hypothetical protein
MRPDLPVYILSSVTGLKRWVDYIPVKSGSYAGRDDSFDDSGCFTPAALDSTTGLQAWVHYTPVYEVADSDAFRWTYDDRGFFPVEYSSGGGGGGGSSFAALDSDGNSFSPTFSVLDSDGNSFTVSSAVLDSDGNSFSPI